MRAKPRPNLLFVLVDCLRSRTVQEASDVGRLPSISGLIERGAFFPTTVATTTTTSPSLASIFTGIPPFIHGLRSLQGYKLDPGVATIAEILRDHGYETSAEATGPVTPETGLDRGFDAFHHRRERVYAPSWDEVRTRLEALRGRGPWFLYIHLFELHAPPSVPTPFDRRRSGRTPYERALTALDRIRLGEILSLAGEDDLLILTGDHGEIVPRFRALVSLGQWIGLALRSEKIRRYFFRRRQAHGFHVYEDLVLVPTVLAGPGIPEATRIDASVRHIDLFPTILELAGIDDPRCRQSPGTSLIELFDGRAESRPGYSEAVGVTLSGPESWLLSVRHDGFKYVQRADGSGEWLWRLPNERRDVSAEHPDVVARMKTLLSEFGVGQEFGARGQEMTADEQRQVEAHLRELGYIE